MFAITISAIICVVNFALSVNIEIPGRIPYIVREPIRIAVTESPGIPRVIMVVIAPPRTPLFAAELTASPSIDPCPYSSGCLLNFFAFPQQIIAEISPPAAGIAPIIVATSEVMIPRDKRPFLSSLFKKIRPRSLPSFRA